MWRKGMWQGYIVFWVAVVLVHYIGISIVGVSRALPFLGGKNKTMNGMTGANPGAYFEENFLPVSGRRYLNG
jgi:hypothetical protein